MYIKFLFFIACFSFPMSAPGQIFNSVEIKKPRKVVEVIVPSPHIREEPKDSVSLVIEIPPKLKRNLVSLPLRDIYVTSLFGYRIDPFAQKKKFHQGVDLRAANDSVFSLLPGAVTKVGRDNRLGKYIVVDHGIYSSVYGHLSKALIKEDEFVRAGQPIAISGNSGRSTAPHLHLAIKKNRDYIDPLPYLNSINELLSAE